jgi:hypothetical protein
MTPEETRRLLGDYATGALTAEERKLLFRAALEDQSLFNALQNEDTLRELLADPVSRDEVRKALEDANRKSRRRPAFWSRRWVFGVAVPAMTAVIVIAVVNYVQAPRPTPPLQPAGSPVVAPKEPIAPQEPQPEPQAASPAPKKQSITKPALVLPAPAPQAVANLRAAAPSQIPTAIRQRFSAGFAADAPLYQGPLVHYSLLRSGAAGQAVRVEVATGIPGYLALYQIDAAGNSTRVYPASEPAVRVLPNATIQIPADPITVSSGQKLRLVVIPAGASQGVAAVRLGGAVAGALQQETAEPAPLIVDIPLASN